MVLRGEEYDARFERLAAQGHYLHGEADLVSFLLADRGKARTGPVLDAGCGTGRVTVELARRGVDVVGTDVDPVMLAAARAKAPDLTWVEADLVDPCFDSRFVVALAAGNVMIFLRPGTAPAVIANLARALVPGGLLVAGFQLGAGLTLDDYDASCSAVGLVRVHRWATWDRRPFEEGDYAVSVHRLGERG
ncbi:MAG TPA: class I SAM-dependent methyltransferase [Acidimicrobiales bacterium]|nr:class I SAM-dependent methyltransferase [Acidimicrobiales bacterium]